jgi:23S rRNA (cytidine2498-2'-O)-methyltransferase
MSQSSRFIYVICQHGAEAAAKKELMGNHPDLKFAFSRPGFVTFKLDQAAHWPEKFSLKSTLARTYGWSLGKTKGTDANRLAQEVADHLMLQPEKNSEQAKQSSETTATTNVSAVLKPVVADIDNHQEVRHLHVWERDQSEPGKNGFEPGISVLAQEISQLIESKLAENQIKIRVNQITRPNECVLDVVLVEPNEWWIGYHYATSPALRWPGGVPAIEDTIEPISRAYYKAAEALAWSGIEIQPGEWCAEIGSSPGGCCQLLLEKGAKVIGIDPAEMDESLLENDNFVHLRKRGNEVRKKDLADVKWLFADLNLVPNYTLDTVSEIVTNAHVHVKGLVLTMKLPKWEMLEKIPELRSRVAELGFGVVKTRQLAFNRQEFCLVAVRDKYVLRIGKKKRAVEKNGKSTEARSLE